MSSDILDRAALNAWGAHLIESYTRSMRQALHLTHQCLSKNGRATRDMVAHAADACGEYERRTLLEFLTEQGIDE